MIATGRYRLARGMRLRTTECETPLLLVPEGVVTLNETAAATLALIDGTRDLAELVQTLAAQFDADPDDLAVDVRALLEAFAERGFIVVVP